MKEEATTVRLTTVQKLLREVFHRVKGMTEQAFLYLHPQPAAETLCETASPHRSHADLRMHGVYVREAKDKTSY